MKQAISMSIFALILFVLPWQIFEITGFLEENENYQAVVSKPSQQIRSVEEIQSTLELADVGFYPEIVNDPLNAHDYNGKRKVAANAGVYFADFMYTKNQGNEYDIIKNYGAIMELAKESDLTNEVTNILIERHENGNNSPEEIEVMLQNALSNSNVYLSQEKQDQLYAYFVMGNYVERMYLTSSIIMRPKQTELPKESEAMLKRNLFPYIAQQSNQLKEVLELFNAYERDEKDELVLEEINALMNSYAIIEAQREEILSLPPDEIFQSEQVVAFFSQIATIRNQITKA